MNNVKSIIDSMMNFGYVDNYGGCAINFLATGIDSEFGSRAQVILRELDKAEEEIRLDQTKKVFEVLSEILKEGSCSYRALIYDKLGFNPGNYEDLLAGMNITNAIVELEEFREGNLTALVLDHMIKEAADGNKDTI